MSIFLPCFRGPGVREAAAREVPIIHSDLEGVFPTNLISLNTELRGGKGVGSSTVTTLGTFETLKLVAHMFLRGGISCGGGGMGCRNCLRKLVARFLASFSLPQSRREAGWHANTIRYCCGGTSDLLLKCAFQMRPTLSDVFFGQRAASTG